MLHLKQQFYYATKKKNRPVNYFYEIYIYIYVNVYIYKVMMVDPDTHTQRQLRQHRDKDMSFTFRSIQGHTELQWDGEIGSEVPLILRKI